MELIMSLLATAAALGLAIVIVVLALVLVAVARVAGRILRDQSSDVKQIKEKSR